MQEAGSEEQGRDLTVVWGVRLAAVRCAHCGEAHLVPGPVPSEAERPVPDDP